MSNLLADILLVLHASFVAFVVSGLVLIIAGKAFSWAWVRNRWFRIVHLGCIGIVVVQSWFGVICPLTTLEMALRANGGGVAYEGTFISHWLGELLYYEAPAWVFVLVYTVFGMLVVFTWFRVPPR
jgi:hypothetical protein